MQSVSTYGPTGQAAIDAVLIGTKWGPPAPSALTLLSYSFPANASFYTPSYGEGEPQNNFAPLNAAQQAAVRAIHTMVGSVANLIFVPEFFEPATPADLRYAASDGHPRGFAYYPAQGPQGGDAWFNRSSGTLDDPVTGNYAYHTFIHETGHALGLKHPHEPRGAFGLMPSDQDSLAYTVMSYRSYTGAPTTEYANGTWDYPQTLMMHDIRAIQQLYGAGFDIVPTDTVYRWNPDTGEMTANRSTPILPGANRIFSTVWDGGGTDVYDFSNYTTDLTVNLGPGEWTTMSSEQLARLDANGSQMAPGNIANALLYNGDLRSIIENAIGGTGNDAMTGNQVANHLDGGDGADALYGLDGNDRLDGGLGDDRLDGGAGNDVAIFVGGRGVYAVRVFESGFRISGPEGSDVLAGIENLEFQDSTMSLAGLLPVALVLSDINADRAGEALWRYEDGRVVSWTLAGGALGSEAQLGTFGSAWTMDAAGDFNGDGPATSCGATRAAMWPSG